MGRRRDSANAGADKVAHRGIAGIRDELSDARLGRPIPEPPANDRDPAGFQWSR
jgi:hypothetical protein